MDPYDIDGYNLWSYLPIWHGSRGMDASPRILCSSNPPCGEKSDRALD